MRFAFITLLIAALTAAVIAIVVVPPEDLRGFQGQVVGTVERIRNRILDRVDNSRQGTQTSRSDRLASETSGRATREASGSTTRQASGGTRRQNQIPDRPAGHPIGAWIYHCDLDQPGSARQCSISQAITDGPQGPVTFLWTISSDPEGNLSSSWRTRTGVKVNRGIVLEAGTPKPVVIPYQECTPQYCTSRANLAADFVATLSGITAARATITTVEGASIIFDIDVDGLADGLRLLQ
jgi:invasion protein IalB